MIFNARGWESFNRFVTALGNVNNCAFSGISEFELLDVDTFEDCDKEISDDVVVGGITPGARVRRGGAGITFDMDLDDNTSALFTDNTAALINVGSAGIVLETLVHAAVDVNDEVFIPDGLYNVGQTPMLGDCIFLSRAVRKALFVLTDSGKCNVVKLTILGLDTCCNDGIKPSDTKPLFGASFNVYNDGAREALEA